MINTLQLLVIVGAGHLLTGRLFLEKPKRQAAKKAALSYLPKLCVFYTLLPSEELNEANHE